MKQLPMFAQHSLLTKLHMLDQQPHCKHLPHSQMSRHLSVSQHCSRQAQSNFSPHLSFSANPSRFILSRLMMTRAIAAGTQTQQTVILQQFLKKDSPVLMKPQQYDLAYILFLGFQSLSLPAVTFSLSDTALSLSGLTIRPVLSSRTCLLSTPLLDPVFAPVLGDKDGTFGLFILP